ncbi:MAG: hypothetical protein ACPGJE_04555, partial [Wenzhouxiangellaceae bacterium]
MSGKTNNENTVARDHRGSSEMINASDSRNKNTDQVIDALDPAVPPAQVEFAKRFLRNLPALEPGDDDPVDQAGMITEYFEFQRQRRAGELKIRVYNPNRDDHGWTSTHTVVEMVNDDMPFLVDSVTLALSRLDIGVHLVLHPVIRLRRDQGGHFLSLADDDQDDARTESLIHIRIDRQTSPDALSRIERHVRKALADVRVAVRDWRKMKRRSLDIADELAESRSGLDQEELAEAREFFHWLVEDHFTFLGYREYQITEHDG